MARPTSYLPEYAEQVEGICKLGATEAQMAEIFGVSVRTLAAWKRKHPEFLAGVKAGKDTADQQVAASLFRLAIGFEHQAVKIFGDPKTGSELIVDYTERYAPNVTACIFWLKNRRPDEWRDKQAIEHTTPGGTGVLAVPLAPTSEQWAAGASAQQQELTARPATAPGET